jgi:hypothetical protein
MKIEKVIVGFSFTKQLRQYEPVRVSSTAEATLEEGDHRDDCVRSLFRLCRDDVRQQLQGLIKETQE